MMPKFRVFERSPLGAYTQSALGARNRKPAPPPPGVGINPIILVISVNRPITRHVWSARFSHVQFVEQTSPWQFVRTEEHNIVSGNYEDVSKWEVDVQRLADAFARVEAFDWSSHNRLKPNYKLLLVQATSLPVVQQVRHLSSSVQEWGVVTNDFLGVPELLLPFGLSFPSRIHYVKMPVPTVPVSVFFNELQAIPDTGDLQSFFFPTYDVRTELRERMVSAWRTVWLDFMGNDTLNRIWSSPPAGQAKYEVLLRSALSGTNMSGGIQPVYRFNQTLALPEGQTDVVDVVQEFLPDDFIQGMQSGPTLHSDRWLARFAGEIESRIP